MSIHEYDAALQIWRNKCNALTNENARLLHENSRIAELTGEIDALARVRDAALALLGEVVCCCVDSSCRGCKTHKNITALLKEHGL